MPAVGIVVGMRILPAERFTIESPLAVEEAAHRLRGAVASPAFSLRPTSHPFRGSVNGNTFAIHRVLGYRNSFRPQVTGRILPGRSGSAIEVTLTLHPLVAAFMIIWLGVAGLIFVGFGIGVLRRATFADEVGFFPFVFLPFGLALCTIAYRVESRKTKRALYRLFGAVAPT